MSRRLPSPLAASEPTGKRTQANATGERRLWPLRGRVVPIATILLANVLASAMPLGSDHVNAQQSLPNSPAQIDWLTGSRLDRSVEHPVSITWDDVPVGKKLKDFADSKRIAIMLDRRIDPEQRVDLAVVNVTVEQFFFRVADVLNLGTCRIGDSWYFGPLETAQSLPAAWQVLPMPSGTVRKPLRWDDLSTPASVLETITQADIRLRNAASIPHDLWHASSLPDLTPAEQLAVIGIGFSQWPRPTGVPNEFELIPFEPVANGTVNYPYSPADQAKPKTLRRQLSREFGDCQFRVTRKEVAAQGPTEQLYEVKRFLVDRIQPETPKIGDLRFTLNTAATRLQILQLIAKQTDRTLDFPPSLRSSLTKRVPIQCKQVSLQELVNLILKDSGLSGEVTATAIELSSK